MPTTYINLTISAEKLAKLIQSGDLCAADFRCLDQDSKQKVWQLCLLCCSNRVGCLKSCTQGCPELVQNESFSHTDPNINTEQANEMVIRPINSPA